MSGMPVELYHPPGHHVQPSHSHFTGNVICPSTNPISPIVQSIIFKDDVQFSEIQHLPENISLSKKMDIVHPNGKWERVSVADILYLHKRKLNTTHLKWLLEDGISVAKAAKIAEEIPMKKGVKLVEEIRKVACITEVDSGAEGLFPYFYKMLNFFSSGIASFLGIKIPSRPKEEWIKSIDKSSSSEEGEIKPATMWHCHYQTQAEGIKWEPFPNILSKEDYFFLKKRGLNRKHFKKFYQSKIEVEELIGMSYAFLNLNKNELFNKIIESKELSQKSQAFQKWQENLFTTCFNEGLKGQSPKALFLISEGFYPLIRTAQLEEHLLRIVSIYNTCVAVFSTMEEFTRVIANHTNIMLLFIMAHGNKNNSIVLKDNDFEFPYELKNAFYSSLFNEHLHPEAHIITYVCSSGNERGYKKNLANFIYLNSPVGVKVFAAEQPFLTNQGVLTKDANGFIVANFWGFRNISKLNTFPVFENIRDISYIVDSTTQLSEVVIGRPRQSQQSLGQSQDSVHAVQDLGKYSSWTQIAPVIVVTILVFRRVIRTCSKSFK